MRIKQILLNLCNNAVKFTSEGQVELHVHFDQKKQRLIFVVADTGPGMSEKQVNRLFTAFTQADESTSRKFGGTGLGLYISQQFAEMLGGHIKVTSEIDVGSQFAIYLPWQTCDSNQMILDEEPYHDMPAQNESDKILIPKLVGNVLCADDNEDNRRLLTYLLAHTGLDVVMVSDGEKAVSHAQNNELDLILMDMQMPNMDGLEATQIIKKSLPTLPIVMLTANVDAQSIQRMEQSGVDENLGKPIDRAAFYALLRNYLPEKKQNTTSNKAKPTKETYEESFKKLAEEYKGRLPQKATELEFALNEQDWKSLKGLAHKLKGSAGSYGFPEVSELAGSVEFALDEENIPHAKTQLSSLFDYIEQTQNTTGV
jgi:CheY-like chemotaxis protein